MFKLVYLAIVAVLNLGVGYTAGRQWRRGRMPWEMDFAPLTATWLWLALRIGGGLPVPSGQGQGEGKDKKAEEARSEPAALGGQ